MMFERLPSCHHRRKLSIEETENICPVCDDDDEKVIHFYFMCDSSIDEPSNRSCVVSTKYSVYARDKIIALLCYSRASFLWLTVHSRNGETNVNSYNGMCDSKSAVFRVRHRA